MSSQSSSVAHKPTIAPFSITPDEVALNVFSFLNPSDLKATACVSRAFNAISSDFQVWKPKIEQRFGLLVAQGAKQSNKSWKQTYQALEVSSKARVAKVSDVLQTHMTKIKTDDLHYRTQRAAAALFGFVAPASSTHYIPTGQTGNWNGRKITVFKSVNQ